MKKSILFFNLCCLEVLISTSFTYLIPIYPEMMLEKGVSMSMIGLILSIYPISFFIISIYLSKYLHKYNNQKVVIVSQINLIVSNLFFLFLKDLDLNWV